MILNRIDDPRDSLERARRPELFAFAQANGIKEITEEMPAIVMRQILRNNGMTRIQVPRRPLGAVSQHPSQQQPALPAAQEKVAEVDMAADLLRQWKEQKAAPPPDPDAVPVAKMDIRELRHECKRLGIKMDRRDNMKSLREKIEAHGKNAA